MHDAVIFYDNSASPSVILIDRAETGALKMRDVKMTDVKLKDQFAGHEIAGHENDGREKAGHENAGMKLQDRKEHTSGERLRQNRLRTDFFPFSPLLTLTPDVMKLELKIPV